MAVAILARKPSLALPHSSARKMLHVIAKVGRSKTELSERGQILGLLMLESDEFGRSLSVPLSHGCRRCQKSLSEPGWGNGCAAARQHPSRRKEGLKLSLVCGQYPSTHGV